MQLQTAMMSLDTLDPLCLAINRRSTHLVGQVPLVAAKAYIRVTSSMNGYTFNPPLPQPSPSL